MKFFILTGMGKVTSNTNWLQNVSSDVGIFDYVFCMCKSDRMTNTNVHMCVHVSTAQKTKIQISLLPDTEKITQSTASVSHFTEILFKILPLSV